MKSKIILLSCIILFSSNCVSAQLFHKKKNDTLHLKNTVVVGQLDKQEERYAIENMFTGILNEKGVKSIPSLNLLKIGADAVLLASDSVQQILSKKGIDTYMLVYVRGYDKRFKPSKNITNLEEALQIGHLFPLYRDEVVNLTFEFHFFRKGELVYNDMIRCGNIASRESVLKKLNKKATKRISKRWL